MTLALGTWACTSEREELPALDLKVERGEWALKQAANDLRAGLSPQEVYHNRFAPYRQLYIRWFYPEVWDSTAFDTLPIHVIDDELTRMLIPLAQDEHWMKLVDSTLKVFPPDYDFKSLLETPFRRAMKHLPDLPAPHVVTFVFPPDPRMPPEYATATQQVFWAKEFVGLGLNCFAGPKFPFRPAQTPVFISTRFSPKYLAVTTLKNLCSRRQKRITPAQSPQFLDWMIHTGIQNYCLDVLLPEVHDSLKIYYSGSQLRWCQEFTREIYHDLAPLFYEKNPLKYQKYISESPFTSGLAQESAPRLGEYLGWQIVRAYMKKHPEITLAQLLKTQDYSSILKESGYKP
jgi:hypothetical protein